jgi:hypothetical protein
MGVFRRLGVAGWGKGLRPGDAAYDSIRDPMARGTRRKSAEWPDDPVVEEVRRWRAKLVGKAGGTVAGMMRYLDERAALRTAEGGSTETKAVRPRRKRRAA